MNRRSPLPVNCCVRVSRTGKRRCAVKYMKAQPAAPRSRAGALISNIAKGARPWARATPSTRMLVEVPTIVTKPPRMVA
ncbi:MAG: hypothetical protein AW07_04139 [Candidatus Accumulibacter sp. SK-11]|nr:MAG: hypothetical protein AW07_04139 [Candidatus Accumulibacter sp. SK-11]